MDQNSIMDESNSPNDPSSTWNEMARKMEQYGFRNGAAEGRSQTFQTGFDIGYGVGFKFAFDIGLSHGYSMVNTMPGAKIETEEMIKNVINSCVVCKQYIITEDKTKGVLSDFIHEKPFEQLVDDQRTSNKHMKSKVLDGLIPILSNISLNEPVPNMEASNK